MLNVNVAAKAPSVRQRGESWRSSLSSQIKRVVFCAGLGIRAIIDNAVYRNKHRAFLKLIKLRKWLQFLPRVVCRTGCTVRVSVTVGYESKVSVRSLHSVSVYISARKGMRNQPAVTQGAWCVKSDAGAQRLPQVWFAILTSTSSDKGLLQLCDVLQLCKTPTHTSGIHVLMAVLWDKSVLQKLLWQVTTKSDAGLTHPLEQTSVIVKKNKNICSVPRTIIIRAHR